MTSKVANDVELKKLGHWAVVVAGISAAFIVLWDQPLAWYFETQLSRTVHSIMGLVTETANSAFWYGLAVAGLAACLFLAKRTSEADQARRYLRHARAWGYMIASMLTAAVLLNFLKLAIGRYRPRYLFNDDISGFEPFGVALKMASFPSGHAQSIWSAMIALSFLTPRFSPFYIAVALAVSASRFITAVHFVSDVIVGSFLSIAVALPMRQWFERNGQGVRLS
tara:strand:- start:800 stop:1471 length:672 start_codon:yes stop_codon:yes gene_type:complete